MANHIKIKSTVSFGEEATAILLADNFSPDWGKYGFTEEEISYINKRKEKSDFILLPGIQRPKFIQVLKINAERPAYFQTEGARKAGCSISGEVAKLKEESLTLAVEAGENKEQLALAYAEGAVLGNYQFIKYKSEKEKEESSLKDIRLFHQGMQQEEIDELNALTEATYVARDLVNEPVIFLTANQLGEEVKKLSEESGISSQVLNKRQIEALKMGGLLSVNKGSQEPPTFSIMEYKPANAVNEKPIVLVGKGVVFDTGGLSLKPTANSMDIMKCDMAGAATVIGAIYAAARAKLPLHIVTLVPATDNRPGENAITPGDVITICNAATVEVLNTDAEGRLILADALVYAKKYNPEVVFDFATLTGAAAAAIGHYGIVCMGTADEKVKTDLVKSGNEVYERLVEFPVWDEFDELLKSDIADMKNIGGPVGGAITAGKFLQKFVDYPWMHFDIAGPAFVKAKDSYRGKNGSGIGVRLLFQYFKNRAYK
jgi:leucyl aminopeptidase